jgi:2-dehydro-3-deoxyphosphooctonate aldolase (KDO 8-P synthase)
MERIRVKDFFIGEESPLVVISGPCVIESEESTLRAAEFLKKLCLRLGIPLIFKSSYDKANRSSHASFRGPGLEEGLKILRRVRAELDLPILTDVHSPEEAAAAGAVCDMIQIPAFLCRQTDLLTAAGKTGAAVNIKKGQFMAPWDMGNAAQKIVDTGNRNILLTDRGTSFGYNNLVSDMRTIPIMKELGFPVCFDASHSVQLPGGRGDSTGGQREFIPTLARAAVAAGANCLFIESHENPVEAKSDRDSVFPLEKLEELLRGVKGIYDVVQAL